MIKKAKSEFGKGLVICLVKFAEHALGWIENEKTLPEHMAVKLFFNAAADHLIEIKVPKKWQRTKIAKKVKELQKTSLEIKFGRKDKPSKNDVIKAYDLCREIALLIDKKIGLKPDIGQW